MAPWCDTRTLVRLPRTLCALCVLCALLACQTGLAWADIPLVRVSASRAEDDRVRIDRSIHYHIDEGVPSCEGSVLRWNASDPADAEPRKIIDGAGLDSKDCACYLPWGYETDPVPDATGLECSWEGSFMHGTCPEPFFCNCSFYCKPVFDAPCNGHYRYEAGVGYYSQSERALILVDWREICKEGDLPSERGVLPGSGCGCFGAGHALGSGPWPHLIVLMVFLLAAVLPRAWHPWRGGREEPGRESGRSRS